MRDVHGDKVREKGERVQYKEIQRKAAKKSGRVKSVVVLLLLGTLHTFQHFFNGGRIGGVAVQQRLMRLHQPQNGGRMAAQFLANFREGIPLFVQTSGNNTTAIGE
jgi:hypothetical protein